MKYYSVELQVDFDKPREMPARTNTDKPWRSVGYFQSFCCTELSKDKAKQLVSNYYQSNETNPELCKFRFDRVSWMNILRRHEDLSKVLHDLTEDMFEMRNQIGIWYIGSKGYYVSEADYTDVIIDEEEQYL